MTSTFTPRVFPRPKYPMSYVWRGLLRLVQLPLLYALITSATAPMYASVHAALTASQWVDVLVKWLEPHAPWVQHDDFFFTAGLSFAVGFSYALCNGFFYVCDEYGYLQEYKCPRKPSQEPSPELIRRTLRKEALAHCFTGPVIMLFVAGPGLRSVGSGVSAASLPPWTTAWKQLTIQLIINEGLFYCGHRLLHTRVLYGAIHKQHHGYVGTRSFAGEYAHFIEDILTAYCPFLCGLFLTRAHFHLVFMWFFLRVNGVAEGHSGYCFRGTALDLIGLAGASSAAHHDFHHTSNSGNFGSPLNDWLFGTMDAYLAIGGEEGYMTMAAAQRLEQNERGLKRRGGVATDDHDVAPKPSRGGTSKASPRVSRGLPRAPALANKSPRRTSSRSPARRR
jgi:sterol desaturase/sphingolipid hydroxylase (fatty acid hydroxylase superfamily)